MYNVYVHIIIYIYIYVYLCVSVCIYIYIYIHTRILSYLLVNWRSKSGYGSGYRLRCLFRTASRKQATFVLPPAARKPKLVFPYRSAALTVQRARL